MILAHPPGRPSIPLTEENAGEAAGWLDLIEPTEAERQFASRLSGLRVPTREQLEEIETSSRLMMEGEVFYLSTPLLRRYEDGTSDVTPMGFVLGPDRLITIRYTRFRTFDTVAQRLSEQPANCSADTTLIMLIEAMVDRMADTLERIGVELDELSARIFVAGGGGRRDPTRSLREMLRDIARLADLLSDARESLLGLGRIALYIRGNVSKTPRSALGKRLSTIGQDITSLTDYIGQVENKVQFLLDATLGFISIEQNNGIRLLTVVSFIGVPPTLIASLYGMNFKNIPELSWNYGYFYALGLMAVSVTGPLLVFWRKGWLGGH